MTGLTKLGTLNQGLVSLLRLNTASYQFKEVEKDTKRHLQVRCELAEFPYLSGCVKNLTEGKVFPTGSWLAYKTYPGGFLSRHVDGSRLGSTHVVLVYLDPVDLKVEDTVVQINSGDVLLLKIGVWHESMPHLGEEPRYHFRGDVTL